MRKNVVLVALLVIGTINPLMSQENQPYSSFWFIDELLLWNKEEDPHAKFNVSHVALADRFVDPSTQVRPELSSEPAIVSLVSANSTSNHPSQGFSTIKKYAFPYWQYIDYFVQWGGSAGEGIIITPAATWIDAAHKNGVEVMGTVFFPPNVYGGKEEWVRAFVQKKSDGSFPVADKLIEVAAYYGFEGWFINQETHGMNELDAQNMQDFMKYYRKKGKDRFKIMWYDAMIEDGRVIWQDEFNDHNAFYFQQEGSKLSDILFIDFGWSETDLEDSRKKVESIGRSSWELFSGIDTQGRSFRTPANWDALYDENDMPYTTSIGLYWPSSTFDKSETKEPEEVYQNEQLYWNGTTFEFRNRQMEWKGFTRFFPARSVINKLPFVTHFNYGLGRFYNEKGERISNNEWHNLTNQDILPTWQWQVDTSLISPTFDFNESYTGGSCIRVDFKKETNAESIPLYKTQLNLTGNESLEFVAKGEGTLTFNLQLSDGSIIPFTADLSNDWNTSSFNLDKYSGIQVVKISLEVSGLPGKAIYLGKIALKDQAKLNVEKPNAKIETITSSDWIEMKVHIVNHNPDYAYDLYKLENGKKQWLGRTHSKDYYLSLNRNDIQSKQFVLQIVANLNKAWNSEPVNYKVKISKDKR